ncbi:MAG TPA: GDSL-type esterase/lipase family protein [Thermoanaerobaculia bacterium]|nr:GDSL-type esterase/lipase family protein [Thermoanaerobaculia bacterium]
MLRRLAARLLLLGFSLGVSLLIAEAAVRLVRPQAVMTVSRGLYVPDPPRRYRLQPGFRGTVSNRVEFDTRVAINREGLRGPEIGPKSPGTLRVLVLGDSFAFGVGAQSDETYPARLQEILRARGIRAEVLNAGAPGYGVPDETAWYERWGKPLAPDVVLVTVFIGNDLQDAVPGPKPMAVDGALVMPGERSGSLSRWLYYHSQLFVLIKNSSLGASLRRLLGRPEPLETRQQREEFDLYAREGTSEMVRQGAAETERAVARLAADAGGARVQAVVIPSLIQVDPHRWQANLRRFGLDPARYDRTRPNQIFEGIFARHNIPVLDLTEPFSAALARGQKIYYSIDQHLTPAGYRLAAERIGRGLNAPSHPNRTVSP